MRDVIILCAVLVCSYLPIAGNGEQSVSGTLPGTVPPIVNTIAFVGNSLTAAGPIYTWTGQWGMAASQPDRDYVHRVQLRLAAASGVIPEIAVYSADFHTPERITTAAQRIAANPPQVLVVQMGDNAQPASDYPTFRAAYAMLRDAAPKAQLIYVGVWRYDDGRNQHIMRIAAEDSAAFVGIHDLFLDPANQAASQGCTDTNGVCWHPSDKGMAAIAERIAAEILPVRETD